MFQLQESIHIFLKIRGKTSWLYELLIILTLMKINLSHSYQNFPVVLFCVDLMVLMQSFCIY